MQTNTEKERLWQNFEIGIEIEMESIEIDWSTIWKLLLNISTPSWSTHASPASIGVGGRALGQFLNGPNIVSEWSNLLL